MKDQHPLQLQILKKLLFTTSLRYTQLKPSQNIESNQLDFHLDQLIKSQHIEKTNQGYTLTSKGKEYANRMDTDQTKMLKQAKVSVAVFPTKKVKNKNYYLIYTRLKQPFFGCQGFMSGKIGYGETVLGTAKRELKEETNLEGKPTLIKVVHFIVLDQRTDELLEDKFMFFCLVRNPRGKVISSDEGKYEWVSEETVFDYVTNHFVSQEQFREDIEIVNNFTGQITFKEIIQKTDKF